MTIGEKLKEAREAQNITLDDLQESTKIQKRYLIAIEEGNFDLLPGTFYARAFIKEYALAVGLDYTALLTEHQDEIPQPKGEVTEQYSRIQRSRRNSRTSSDTSAIFSLIPRIIVILLIVGIIFIAWTLIQQSLGENESMTNDDPDSDAIIRPPKDITDETEDEEDESVENAEDEVDEGQDTTEADEKITMEVTALGTGRVPESTIIVNHSAEQLLLTFTTDERSWLDVVTPSGENLYGKELSQDESPLEFDITAHEEIRINAGNSTVLSVTINDELIDFPVEGSVHQKLILQFNKN